jgi:hypothetical protein
LYAMQRFYLYSLLLSLLHMWEIWQDVALTIINFGFIVTAVPAVIRNYQLKEVKSQSLLMYLSTSVLLTVMAYVFFTLNFLTSSLSTLGTGIMWYLLTAQKILYSK